MKIIVFKPGMIMDIPVYLGINYLYPVHFRLPDNFLKR